MANELPDFRELGGLPSAGGAMPIGRPDPSPIARGAAALAQSGVNLGKGVEALGEGVAQLGIDRQRYEYATAHANFLAKKIDLDASLAHDQDYATLPQRYGEAITKLQSDVGATISNPAMRDRFTQATNVQVAEGNAKTAQHAFMLEGNQAVADTQQGGDDLINKAVTLPVDSPDREAAIGAQSARLAALRARGFITAEQELAMREKWAHSYALADGLERMKTDPQGVINDLRAAPGSPAQITNRILQIEGNGQARGTTASGYGGFTEGTWLSTVKRYRPDLAEGRTDQQILALRGDRGLGYAMTEALRGENETYLKGQGLPATPGQQYLAHFLGPAGATAVIKANPNQPVDRVLAAAVGPDKAAKMIAVNPTILRGQLAGSVAQWADAKMGGVGPGGGHLYDVLRPDQRAMLLNHAEQQLQRQQTSDRADFKIRVGDSQAEAMHTGAVANPIAREEFIARMGPDDGEKAYAAYQANVGLGRDVANVATMSPEEQQALVAQYEPKPGSEGYADQSKRQDALAKAINQANKERDKDPAAYAISRLPASGEAWAKFGQVKNDPNASPSDVAAAARAYAERTIAEQAHAGVYPEAQRLLPKDYIDGITKVLAASADSDDPGKRVALISQIQREAAVWGDNWPAVMRQMADKTQPIVRAIAAGADTGAMTRLLSLPKDEAKKPSLILQQQDGTKSAQVTTALNTAFADFRRSLVGRQLDRDYPGYYQLGQELAALHVRDGDSASDAAAKAFNELIGNRYDFRDTWRIPKSAGISADEVQAGTGAARYLLAQGPKIETNFEDAKRDLNLTPQEQALYQRHLSNLLGPGGVDNPDGSRSSLYQVSFEQDGRAYNVPSVYNGKIVSPTEAISRAKAEGLEKFPSYGSTAEAEARYAKMHDYMEEDTARFLTARKSNPLFGVKPPLDDMPGRTEPNAQDFAALARDGRWVTSHDNSGLNLVTPGGNFARGADGRVFVLPWAKLAELGRNGPMRPEALAAGAVQ